MADTIKKLADGSCPLIAADVFTATAKTSVLAIDIANYSGLTQTVTVKMHGFVLIPAVTMPVGGGISWHGPQVLEIGHTINIVADSASCDYHVTGVEIV